jgi:hypothetical protein
MSLSEQFLANQTKLSREDAEEFVKKTNMDSSKIGFIISRTQFAHIARNLKPMAKSSHGIWANFQFHPKSKHIVFRDPVRVLCEVSGDHVYIPLAMTEAWDYFRWHVGPRFPEDWVSFNDMLDSFGNFNYIVFMKIDDYDHFVTYSNGKYMQKRTHVGGGRGYHEPSARPWEPYGSHDKIIDENGPIAKGGRESYMLPPGVYYVTPDGLYIPKEIVDKKELQINSKNYTVILKLENVEDNSEQPKKKRKQK